MIPRWKIKRELNRTGEQIRALLSYPIEPFRKWKHDRDFFRNIRLNQGEAPLGDKIAIYLVYQPRGVLGSTAATCRHLREQGYSVLLVSNATLGSADLRILTGDCWKIVERPNYGYDFGGYRDGIRLLRELEVEPEALVILNDSIWWPIFETDTILQRMETADCDVVGTIMHKRPGRRRAGRHRPAFLESYFFWFSRRALQSAAFHDFWRDYRVSSIKYNAVHRGERRFTSTLARAGLSVHGLFSREELSAELRKAGPEEILKALRYGAYIDPEFSDQAAALMEDNQRDTAWTDRAIRFVETCTIKRGFHAAFPYASIKFLEASFLKKAPAQANGSIHHIMRDRVLEAVVAKDLSPMQEVVFREVTKRQIEGAEAVGR